MCVTILQSFSIGCLSIPAIEQRTIGANPRSTVGSVTKIADILKLLFATIKKFLIYYTFKVKKFVITYYIYLNMT